MPLPLRLRRPLSLRLPMSNYLKKEQLIALLLTLLFAALTCTLLVCVKVLPASASIPPAPAVEEQEVFFADIEYQEIKVDPTPQVDGSPASAAAAEVSGTDMTDAGNSPEMPTLVSTSTPSEAKVTKPESPKPAPGPTQEEIEAQKAAAIRERMGRSTGLKTQTSDAGSGTAESGQAAAGNNPGADGLGLDGRKRLNSPNPGIKNATGKVKVRVRVNSAGDVTEVSFVSSSGFGTREREVRDACLSASRQLKYSPNPDKPSQSGIITWNIR